MGLKDKVFGTSQNDNLSYSGNGKISVPLTTIVNSEKVQRQVSEVKKMAEAIRDKEKK